jgi:hypothetical protein
MWCYEVLHSLAATVNVRLGQKVIDVDKHIQWRKENFSPEGHETWSSVDKQQETLAEKRSELMLMVVSVLKVLRVYRLSGLMLRVLIVLMMLRQLVY